MNYCLLSRCSDEWIPTILAAYSHPSVARFISINETKYWKYVTETDDVWFFKIFEEDRLIATTHLELSGSILYMDIVVFPEYQRRGTATQILREIQQGKLGIAFDKIQVSIEQENAASIRLFEKAGFACVSKEDNLLEYVYIK